MPSKTGKQYRFMQAVAHGSSNRAMSPSKEVAKEFVNKTSPAMRKKFSKKGKK